LATTRTPEGTEEALKALLPESLWGEVNELFISFGREICRPVGPKCGICPFAADCRYNKERIAHAGERIYIA
jgi:endonuclease-3